MKFGDDKKKESIEILKKALEISTDEKEKYSIQQLKSVYENQIGNNIIDMDEHEKDMLQMNLMEESNIENE